MKQLSFTALRYFDTWYVQSLRTESVFPKRRFVWAYMKRQLHLDVDKQQSKQDHQEKMVVGHSWASEWMQKQTS